MVVAGSGGPVGRDERASTFLKMKMIYFDTNVFDHIQKRYVSDEQIATIRSAVRTGKIQIIFSYLNVEEVLSAIELLDAKEQLRLIMELADTSKFVASHDIIVLETIRSYALGIDPPSPFSVCNREMRKGLESIARHRRVTNNVRWIIEEVRKQKEQFKQFLEGGKAYLLPHAEEIKRAGIRYCFDDYFQKNCRWLAEGLAERAGMLEQCRVRGIDGLLEIPAIRMAVGANLSLIYSHHFEGRTPKIGDSRDILHAILATSAGFFVTQDQTLAKLLRRIPMKDFEVTDFQGLLATLRA